MTIAWSPHLKKQGFAGPSLGAAAASAFQMFPGKGAGVCHGFLRARKEANP